VSDGTLPFGKDAKPDYLEVQDRRPLTKWEFATLFLKQEGKCAVCGSRLERGKVRDEHLHALNLGGGNELTNRALWCLDCTKPKDATDKAAIAKGKRLRKETCNGPKRKIQQRNTFDRPSLPFKLARSESPSKWGRAGGKKSWPKGRGFSRSARKPVAAK